MTLAAVPTAGASAARDIPPPLQPWIDWVLHGHEDAFCPLSTSATSVQAPASQPEGGEASVTERVCSWPSRLELILADEGGRFAQDWQVFGGDTWLPLPGDLKTWPQEVRVDGRPAPVSARDETPSVRLVRGRHRVEGHFVWSALPPLLPVPSATALLDLSVRGKAVAFPARDAEGRIWLQKREGAATEESRLDVNVYRHLHDDVPAILTTRIALRVSGRGREVVLGAVLPKGFVPMSLSGPLPAHLQPDGTLVAQVRPGVWELVLVARHDGPTREISRPPAGSVWPQDEIWVVQAEPSVRVARVDGVASIDAQQTTIPEEWRGLPAYLVRPGDSLRLVESQRGDADPAEDRLTLARTLWLDFDGGGFTAHDRIAGQFVRSWRMEMPAPGQLGRVTVDGEPQVITRRDPKAPAGFEVRQGRAAILADSRIPRAGEPMPATGWNSDFREASLDLRLPPGWRILHASGADETGATWIASWNLLDLFLVLLIAMSVARLWGWHLLWLALAGLGLSWIEPGAPRWTWAAAVASAALAGALPPGRLKAAARLVQATALVALLVWLLPFLALQARTALHPALEAPMNLWPYLGAGGLGEVSLQETENAVDDLSGHLELQNNRSLGYASSGGAVSSPGARPAPPPPPSPRAKEEKIDSNLAADPKAAAQTGPGLPGWMWRRASLQWRGPVDHHQTLRLWLLPPWLNVLLAWTRVGLLGALALVLLKAVGVSGRGGWSILPRAFSARPAAVLVAVAALAALASAAIHAPNAAAAEIPPKEALDSLRDRLLEPPDCLPDCLSLPRLLLEAEPARLTLRLELHAAALVAAPLPGSPDQWQPVRVVLDGAPAAALRRGADGRLFIALSPGTHQVVLEGPLPDRDIVPISLPLPPGRAQAHAQGWRVEGIDDGRAQGTLQLTRVGQRGGAAPSSEGGTATLVPFVRVERSLQLGLRWQVSTRVTRLTPAGTALLLEVPLLRGESVTSDQQVAGDRAVVRLAPDATEARWDSLLPVSDEVALRAPDGVAWTEVWRVAVGPVWHIETEGPPSIHPEQAAEVRVREWRPWPGEILTLHATRPAAVSGQTLTIDRSALTLTPGLRSSDAALDLTLRASRGGEHAVTLPAGATLQSVTINKESQPIRQNGAAVTLPMAPGRQEIRLEWREPRGLRAWFSVEGTGLGIPSINASTLVHLPADRWILLVGGPRLGPAVLFWSLLVIALMAALVLGALPITPLRWPHWFGLAIGLSQVPVPASIVIVGWLLALGARRRYAVASGVWFNLRQVALAAWTLAALVGLFWVVQQGLLGAPEMQISGNGSSPLLLNWYVDRTDGSLPRPWIVSVPILVYRLAMLAWALWLAAALVRWLRWGWESLNTEGLWKPWRRPPAPDATAQPAVPPPLPSPGV
jgi:hypothetical protein